MKLLGDQLLVVKGDDLVRKTKNIIIPESIQPHTGVCYASINEMGSKFRYKDDLQVGDLVLIPLHFGTEINGGLTLIDGEDVLARVDS